MGAISAPFGSLEQPQVNKECQVGRGIFERDVFHLLGAAGLGAGGEFHGRRGGRSAR